MVVVTAGTVVVVTALVDVVVDDTVVVGEVTVVVVDGADVDGRMARVEDGGTDSTTIVVSLLSPTATRSSEVSES